MTRALILAFYTSILFATPAGLLAQAAGDRSDVPLEVDSTDPALTKIVLVAGSFSKGKGKHEYFAGCAMLMNMLKQTPGVFPVMAAEGWPRNEKIFQGAKAVVFYLDGGGKQPYLTPERMAMIDKLMAQGVGMVQLHQTVDYPTQHTDHMIQWLGGVYVPGASARGHWDAEFKDFVLHPTTRGVTTFKENDGFLYKLKFAPQGVTPLLRSSSAKEKLTGTDDIVAWSFQRTDGGRSFSFTGCDGHKEWGLEGLRRFVVNGILWSAGKDIPAGGAPVALDPADLQKHLDPVPPAAAKPAKAATTKKTIKKPAAQKK